MKANEVTHAEQTTTSSHLCRTLVRARSKGKPKLANGGSTQPWSTTGSLSRLFSGSHGEHASGIRRGKKSLRMAPYFLKHQRHHIRSTSPNLPARRRTLSTVLLPTEALKKESSCDSAQFPEPILTARLRASVLKFVPSKKFRRVHRV